MSLGRNRATFLKAGVLAGALVTILALIVLVANPGQSPDPGQELALTARPTGDHPTPTFTPTRVLPERQPTKVLTPAHNADLTPVVSRVIARRSTDFFQIAVGEIRYAREYATHRTDQTLCVIPVTATNIGSQDRILVLSDFYLLDSENHRHSTVHSEGMATRIPPDASESGTLVFELPTDASPRQLVLSDSSHAAQVLLRLELEP